MTYNHQLHFYRTNILYSFLIFLIRLKVWSSLRYAKLTKVIAIFCNYVHTEEDRGQRILYPLLLPEKNDEIRFYISIP